MYNILLSNEMFAWLKATQWYAIPLQTTAPTGQDIIENVPLQCIT